MTWLVGALVLSLTPHAMTHAVLHPSAHRSVMVVIDGWHRVWLAGPYIRCAKSVGGAGGIACCSLWLHKRLVLREDVGVVSTHPYIASRPNASSLDL